MNIFPRPLRWIFARHVMTDAGRLVRRHGVGAVFIAQAASVAAHENRLDNHWSRVRCEVEARARYYPF